MTKRMLIDASHAEETRVVVLDGNRLEDFDFETAAKRQLKGNIYLAKVVRVEPSLQAAFVDYGGNRHGFLAFSEIHPDYYQIPVADRQRLLEMQAEDARREQEEEDRAAEAEEEPESEPEPSFLRQESPAEDAPIQSQDIEPPPPAQALEISFSSIAAPAEPVPAPEPAPEPGPEPTATEAVDESGGTTELLQDAPAPATPTPEPDVTEPVGETSAEAVDESGATAELLQRDDLIQTSGDGDSAFGHRAPEDTPSPARQTAGPETDREPAFESLSALEASPEADSNGFDEEQVEIEPPPETIGGESEQEFHRERRAPPRFLRQYKIQEVIHRRQILLVQVVKEERGTKGAALTTYISLAGRYCVLMPNSPRGGGISRKITSLADRRRLKEVIAELDLPQGMGLIVRTAGANRPKPEIKRDCEYLLRLWDDVREHTLRSIAPTLIYEEANLIKRAIRDVYSRDVDEIEVDGEDGWKAAREFMRMLMPSHAKKVQFWRDPNGQPLFAHFQVDAQLDAILSPIVQLRSGGYLVINQAEALVAIDVNSGRSTRERGIEETALRTNLEAADEVARQLRLRDLAGLVVIDFIDMESRRHNGMVERRLKEALKADRARIQVGYISHFGLLEMSRQRLRPSLAETSFVLCPHCGGTGHIRTIESAAIQVLRAIEEEGGKRRAAEIVVHTTPAIALYIFNHKRVRLAEIEARYTMRVVILTQDGIVSPPYRIERIRAQTVSELQTVVTPESAQVEPARNDSDAEDEGAEPEEVTEVTIETEGATEAEDSDNRRRRRRRRRRGGHREEQEQTVETAEPASEDEAPIPEGVEGVPETAEPANRDDDDRRRGRRRGGRRRRRDDDRLSNIAAPGAEQPDMPPIYAGPTPADPFGGQVFDIFDAIEQAEAEPAGTAQSQVAAEPELTLPVVETPPRSAEPMGDVEPESASDIASEPRFVAAVPMEAAEPEPAMQAHEAEPTAEPAEPEAVAEPVHEEPPAPANDPEPLVKPIIVGADEVQVEKKRGWWRR